MTSGRLQSAASAFARFYARGEPSLVWGADGNGGGGDVLRAYLDVAARLLSPEVEDGACVFAAPLLGQMLRRLPRQMSPLLPEIVAAVVARVRSAKQPNLIAALLSIFARLVHADCNALVALLAGMPAPPLPPGIEPTDADTGADGIPPPTSALEPVARVDRISTRRPRRVRHQTHHVRVGAVVEQRKPSRGCRGGARAPSRGRVRVGDHPNPSEGARRGAGKVSAGAAPE